METQPGSFIAGIMLTIAVIRVVYIFIEKDRDKIGWELWRRNWLEVGFLFLAAIVVGVLSRWIRL